MKLEMKHIFFLGITAVMFFSGCKKDTIEIPESNDPVFTARGTLSGEEFFIVAGDNGAYMHTMTNVENGVNVYSGNLSNGDFGIELGVFDGLLDLIDDQFIVELLTNNTPGFAHSEGQPLAELNKNLIDDLQNVHHINWYVNNVFAGVDIVKIQEPGKYYVCANVTFNDMSTASYCNELIIGFESGANCTIHSNVSVAGELICSLINNTEQVIELNWYLDDVLIGSNIYVDMLVSPEIHNLRAEITFANGVRRTKEVLIDGTQANRDLADFTIFEENQVQVTPRDFNLKLAIERNGKHYHSILANNANSIVEITNIEKYENNSAGNDVYKISANINANLLESDSMKETEVQLEVTFGIEIP
ncbi:MAG: hypothetical protein MK105_13090 [Crocinitomicaceae bacterium]|nr:hypothetical protein [Crocinitomicaceae bacterium]